MNQVGQHYRHAAGRDLSGEHQAFFRMRALWCNRLEDAPPNRGLKQLAPQRSLIVRRMDRLVQQYLAVSRYALVNRAVAQAVERQRHAVAVTYSGE